MTTMSALVLAFLKENGLDENTIVWYSTDNGPEHSSWPHGANTPFRGEKMTTYEGGVRVVSMLRWPGTVKAGTVRNGIQAHRTCSPAWPRQRACPTWSSG